jgi:hypothetical protein
LSGKQSYVDSTMIDRLMATRIIKSRGVTWQGQIRRELFNVREDQESWIRYRYSSQTFNQPGLGFCPNKQQTALRTIRIREAEVVLALRRFGCGFAALRIFIDEQAFGSSLATPRCRAVIFCLPQVREFSPQSQWNKLLNSDPAKTLEKSLSRAYRNPSRRK